MSRRQVLSCRSSISSAVATGSAACCASTESLRSRPLLASDAHTPRWRAHHFAKLEAVWYPRARVKQGRWALTKTDTRGARGIRAGPGSSSGESRTEFSAPAGTTSAPHRPLRQCVWGGRACLGADVASDPRQNRDEVLAWAPSQIQTP